MYVKRSAIPRRFPPNYSGNLVTNTEEVHRDKSEIDEHCDSNSSIEKHHEYKVRKNSFKRKDKPQSLLENASNDDLLLLGLLIFLYVGCEHSKENLILMGVLAYLLFTN